MERLYEVRDVVEARLEKGRERYEGFVRDRECRVAVELRRRVELVKKQRNNSKNGNSSYGNNGERIGCVETSISTSVSTSSSTPMPISI